MLIWAIVIALLAAFCFWASGIFFEGKKPIGGLIFLLVATFFLAETGWHFYRVGVADNTGFLGEVTSLEDKRIYRVVGRFSVDSLMNQKGLILDDGTGNIRAIFEKNPSVGKAEFVRRDNDRLLYQIPTSQPATSSEKLPPIPDPESDGN